MKLERDNNKRLDLLTCTLYHRLLVFRINILRFILLASSSSDTFVFALALRPVQSELNWNNMIYTVFDEAANGQTVMHYSRHSRTSNGDDVCESCLLNLKCQNNRIFILQVYTASFTEKVCRSQKQTRRGSEPCRNLCKLNVYQTHKDVYN